MPCKPSEIANYFLHKGQDDPNMTPMKLIKLVYIAHGWSLGLYKKPLISESPQAWKFGPVIPTLYDTYKKFGNKKIETEIKSFDDLPEGVTAFLDKIWDVYGNFNGVQLSAKTHQPNTPWSITWEKAKDYFHAFSLTIPDDLIKKHYSSKIEGVEL
ncbi:Panacea domain-containing protein [Flavobacterium sp. B183]|uniref:Panacea domain-containing protein n=1 Tax=Flavobacterium sp. B183 TaxID=907046 RepID=UPI00201F643D|nr:type II toxin-antitoxin system antitoxin SocA domain-containing protein [Flavobacterium sp. B183]URC12523.1 DUF4065 domain-containing protein [Flavobacterium sp. B183]